MPWRHGVFAVVLVVFRSSKVLRRSFVEQGRVEETCSRGSCRQVFEKSVGFQCRGKGWALRTSLDFLRCPFSDPWTRTMTGFTFLMTYLDSMDLDFRCWNFHSWHAILECLQPFFWWLQKLVTPKTFSMDTQESPWLNGKTSSKTHHFRYPAVRFCLVEIWN